MGYKLSRLFLNRQCKVSSTFSGNLAHCPSTATVEKGSRWSMTLVPSLMRYPDWFGQRRLTGV